MGFAINCLLRGADNSYLSNSEVGVFYFNKNDIPQKTVLKYQDYGWVLIE